MSDESLLIIGANINERAAQISGAHPLLARGFAILAVLLPVTFGYLELCRPYQLHWGATAAEIERPMLGNELNADPSLGHLSVGADPLDTLSWGTPYDAILNAKHPS
jgi:hypothetical protein